MDVITFCFKINLFKALATINTPPPPHPSEIRVDHFCPRLNEIDLEWVRGGVIAVPMVI